MDKAFKDFFPPRPRSNMTAHISVRDCWVPFSFRANVTNFPAVGIIGATVIPHGPFLGSALATQNRASVKPIALSSTPSAHVTGPKGFIRMLPKHFRPIYVDNLHDFTSHADRPNNPLSSVKAHPHHGVVDLVINLLGLAVIINSM